MCSSDLKKKNQTHSKRKATKIPRRICTHNDRQRSDGDKQQLSSVGTRSQQQVSLS